MSFHRPMARLRSPSGIKRGRALTGAQFMKPVAYLTALAAALILVSGCGPKPASEVNKDVDKAASQAQKKQADANASVADTVTAAKSDVRDAEKDSQHQIAGAEADAATVKAKGDHKVAL